jgi:tetratricopeptide (TPR) repeat protein
VAGYNVCNVTRSQYYEGILRIYPRLKGDAISLEQIRRELAAGRKANEVLLRKALDVFVADLRSFAAVSNQQSRLDQIEFFVRDIQKNQQANSKELAQISSSLEQMKEELKQLSTPAQIDSAVLQAVRRKDPELTRQLQAWTDLAQTEYRAGYNLLQQFSFSEALPHLRKAYEAVRLPEFAVAVATALRPLLELKEAEVVLRSGISDAATIQNEAVEARLRRILSRVLRDRGDLQEAKVQAELAVQLSQHLYGEDNSETALAESDLGMILYSLGDYPGAKQNLECAMMTNIRINGEENQQAATDDGNLGLIYLELDNLPKAEELLRKALKIDTAVFGPTHITVAADYTNLSNVLVQKGDLAGAQRLIDRSVEIDKGTFGPNHPVVAQDHVAYSEILRKQGRKAEAQTHFEIALSIYVVAYGAQDSRTKKLHDSYDKLFGQNRTPDR